MKNAGKACNNRLYRHIRTFEKIVKNYFVIYIEKNRIRFHYDAEELWIELPGDGTLWKESETEKEYSGGQWICVPVTLESMPVFIKK